MFFASWASDITGFLTVLATWDGSGHGLGGLIERAFFPAAAFAVTVVLIPIES